MNEQKNTTKTQIKQAAIRQIEKFGIDKTSMRSIAAEANMTTGAIYYYYKNKHESRELLLDRIKEDKILFNSIDSNKIKIVLCHSPINISNKDVSNELENFNFIFCGHMHNGMMPYYLDKIIKGNRGLMSPDNRLFADNTRGVKDINNTHLIISGGITKLSKTSGIFRYFNFVYPMSIDNIVINKGKIKKKVDIL